MNKVVTRIPPSPTGRFHIGTARTALVNFLFARHHKGKFIFRSEDTDKVRSKKEFEDEIVEGLNWLGLTYDSFSRQSENVARHTELLEKLVGEGKAYISKEESREEAGKEVEVVRLKNEGRSITFHDEVHGDITFDTTELKDFVIARSLQDPLYHFAVVVDDWDSGVTHVIRGEDHISNTPRQILIQEALGAPRPIYAHVPLILDDKRAKLSKRSGTTLSVMDYRAQGYLPEGIVNYLALLGWSPGNDREDFSLAELVESFSLEGIQKSGASWDKLKLLSVNQRWMRKLTDQEFITRGGFDASALRAVPLLKDRAHTFEEAREMLTGELRCLFEKPVLEKTVLIAKEKEGGETSGHLTRALDLIGIIGDHALADEVKAMVMPYAEEKGRGAVLWPLRYALSGQEKSPDPFNLISILGTKEATERIHTALDILTR